MRIQTPYKCNNYTHNDNLNKTCQNLSRCVLISDNDNCYQFNNELPDVNSIDIEAILYSEKFYNPAYEHHRLKNETDAEYRERLKDIWLKRLQCK